MPIDAGELLRAAEIVASKRNMRIAAKYSLFGGIVAGLATAIGGILAGPIGLFVGGTVGGAGTAIYSAGKFKSVVDIIHNELTPHQQAQLCAHLEKAVENFDLTDFVAFASMVTRNEMILLAIAGGIKNFIESDMNLQLLES